MSEDLSNLLATARRNNTTIAPREEIVPGSAAEAFAVSAATIAALGETVIGWKVGFIPDGRIFGAPMLSAGLLQSGGEWRRRTTGPLLVEIEIALRLGRDLPPRPGRPYSREEVLNASSAALVGFELLECRFGETAGLPPLLFLADDLGNVGYVVGADVPDFGHLDLGALRCRLWIDDELVNDRIGGHLAGDPVAPVVAWANAQADAVGGLKAGHIVTTGTLTTPVRLERPARLRGAIDSLGEISLDVF